MILGRTGTGKTVAGLWHLSNYDLKFPWVMIDFKRDKHIKSIEKAEEIDLNWKPSKKSSGLYVVRPHKSDTTAPRGEVPAMDKFIDGIWHTENCGIFCDEGIFLANSDPFDECLIQGRSKFIPMITCSQRPVWLSSFAKTEAGFFQVFHLNSEDDRRTVCGFTPLDTEDFDTLKKFESFYYDVGENELVRFKPVPNMDKVRETFDAKLPRKFAWI